MARLYTNNATSVLASGITNSATSLTVVAGNGAKFPSPSGGDYFLATLIGLDTNGNENAWEIIKVTARSTDTMTIVRAQESTSGVAWSAGARIELRATAGAFSASAIGNTPSGNIASTDVQAAINELDSEKQPLDATLTALAGVTTAADKMIYATGVDAFAVADLTPVARSLLDDTTVAAMRATLGLASNAIQDFRLSLTSGTPVTTSDVTGATTIYAVPFKGNYIDLYDGAAWNRRSSAQFSLALGTLSSGKPYDVFCYDNATVPTLEFLAWTNGTTRATALAYQDGVLVKSGAATRRYLGTFYTTSTTTTEDSAANRYLWNYNNRVRRKMQRLETTASWSYTTAAYRQANGSSSNQLNFIIGYSEDVVRANVIHAATVTSSVVNLAIAIGLDSTSSASGLIGTLGIPTVGGVYALAQASYCDYPGVGVHYLAWLEYGGANTTFYGGGTDARVQTGIHGEVYA